VINHFKGYRCKLSDYNKTSNKLNVFSAAYIASTKLKFSDLLIQRDKFWWIIFDS